MLNALLSGASRQRPDTGIAVCKSTGSGFQDIVIAKPLYDWAMDAGRGTVLRRSIRTITK